MEYNDPRVLLFFLATLLIVYFTFSKDHFTLVNLSSNLSKEELQSKIKELQDQLYTTEIEKQRYISDLLNCQNIKKQQIVSTGLPFRQYINPKNEIESSYTQLGFVFNDNDRYPLYGRHLYPGRSDKWEYFIIDETRNRLRIPFKTQNNNELSTGDSVFIPTLNNTYQVEIYEYDNFRYNPNVF